MDGSVAYFELKKEKTPELLDELGKGYLSDWKMKRISDILDHESSSFIKEKYFWDETMERLYLKDRESARLCIPRGPLRRQLLQRSHDDVASRPPGRDRTLLRLSRSRYWSRVGRNVTRYVKSCDTCQHNKTTGHKNVHCVLWKSQTNHGRV